MNIKKIKRNLNMTLVMSAVYIITNRNQVLAKMPRTFTIDWSEANQFEDLGNTILGTLRVIGSIASVGALMYIGIKCMLGSVEEKSEMKENLVYYVIGSILVFSIANILPIIYNFATDLF